MYLYNPAPPPLVTPLSVYRVFVRAVCATCLVTTFWPVLRLGGLTLFDCLAPIALVIGLSYVPKDRGAPFTALGLALLAVGLLALGGVISYPSSNEPLEHLQKVATLIVALGGIIGLSFALVNRKIFTPIGALSLMCLSATGSSFVAILQGKFHILTGLIPVVTTLEASNRMTGLCEHPIETGITAAFGSVIGFGLALHTRKWMTYLPLVAVNVLSMIYSASLTAVIALLASGFAYCIFAKAYRALAVTSILGTVIVAAALSYTGLGLLTSRLQVLAQSQGSYSTLQYREQQWGMALALIEPATLVVGNGYSTADLPQGKEIHNGLVASLFHFGLIGLLSQTLMFAFFGMRLFFADKPRDLRAILLACIVIFTLSYMTGPALSRRSLWVPMIVLGAYLSRESVLARTASRNEVRKFSPTVSPGVRL